MGVGDCRRDRLVDFMGNRSRQLPHRRDAVRVRQLHLCLAVSPLALAQAFLRPLALGHIEDESDALVSAFVESRRADSTGTRLPSLRKYSFSNGCKLPVS